jgi:hypothetical protein
MKIIILLCGMINLVVLLSCSRDELPENNLFAIKAISEVNDSIFFSAGFADIKFSNNKIYASDLKADRILIFNENLELENIFGITGNGPGELRNPSKLFLSNDTIFVYDVGGNRINVYRTNGNYLKQIILEKGTKIYEEFVVKNGNIYVSNPLGDYPISVFDLDGRLINQFGIWISTSSAREKIERNYRNISIDSMGNIITVLLSEPIVEKYDLYGNLIQRLNLSSLDLIQDRLIKVRETQEKDRQVLDRQGISTVYLFPEFYIDGNSIYILCTNQVDEKLVEFTNILELVSDNDNKLHPLSVIKLTSSKKTNELRWYLSICISGNRIFASDALNCNLVKFER